MEELEALNNLIKKVQGNKQKGKALGFRTWYIRSDKPNDLCSVSATSSWLPDKNTAKCIPLSSSHFPVLRQLIPEIVPDHESPNKYCDCGLYGYHEIGEIQQHYEKDSAMGFSSGAEMFRIRHDLPLSIRIGVIYGAVLGWGRMRVHPTGFRCQYAQPIVITPGYGEISHRISRYIAEEWCLDWCANVYALMGVAEKHGYSVIPVHQRPVITPADRINDTHKHISLVTTFAKLEAEKRLNERGKS